MGGFRKPDGLDSLLMMLSYLLQEVRMDGFRRNVQRFNLVFFGSIFLALVIIETLFASMMFSILQVEILGTSFSGAAFAMLVPTVIGAAHVKMHHEGDHFTKWWLKNLSGIGILLFALGVSLMVGFSAWQAAQDATTVASSLPEGSLGDQLVNSAANGTSEITGWIAMVPNTMLFLGLSFGMIITIYFASFCVGRALQAFNILTLTPPVGPEVKLRIEQLHIKIAAFRKLDLANTAAQRKLPFDLKTKFAREAANASWRVVQAKLALARRSFDPLRHEDPLRVTTYDPAMETIPTGFATEDELTRHLADQMDVMRMHNLLRVLTGIPETPATGDKS